MGYLCERALKRAVLHRKNALFYRTLHGAQAGDLFMSLIHTCELSAANPFDYLTEVQRHARELAGNPAGWMPWNYRETLTASELRTPAVNSHRSVQCRTQGGGTMPVAGRAGPGVVFPTGYGDGTYDVYGWFRGRSGESSHCRASAASAGYFWITIFGSGIGLTGSNKPKLRIAVADAIATYCFPSSS
jgi:hypothetical protein